jgi:hypothetical protein
VDKKVVPQATYDEIKDRIVAHRGEGIDAKTTPRGRDAATADVRSDACPSRDGSGPTVSTSQTPHKGDVWVKTASAVFHREGDPWYGKTKQGKYMSEDEALRAGYRESKQGASKQGASKQ